MDKPLHWLATFEHSLRAHGVRDLLQQERERTRTRVFVVLTLSAVWIPNRVWIAGPTVAPDLVLAVGALYALATLLYTRAHRTNERAHVRVLLGTLFLDPALLICLLAAAPEPFAVLNPFVLLVVVRTAFRYGLPSLYLTWGAALAIAPTLLLNRFWIQNIEFAFAFLLMLALIPLFFAPLIRRVGASRRVEEERLRVAAMHEAIVSRTAFLAKVSHELRSPLQGIVSALDVLEMRQVQSLTDNDELVQRIRRSSTLLNAQLRDLLTLARGEAGQLVAQPQTFEAASLVEAVGDAARPLAHAKGLALRVDVSSDPIFVVSDGPRIDQILTNLVVNAIKYTERGEVCVTLRSEAPLESRLSFEVADTGPGLPVAARETLMAGPDIAMADGHRGEGSGLGLAIVRTLVALLGGRITVTADGVHGTSIRVDIPVQLAHAEADSEEAQEEAGRLLIVDDRDDVLDALASVAAELGYECDIAMSATRAADLLATRRYEAVILDIEMPLKGGLAIALETRRGDGPNRKSRLVGMTAGGLQEADRTSFDAWLIKPVDRAALRWALGLTEHGFRPSQPGLWEGAAAGASLSKTDAPLRSERLASGN